MKNLIAIIACAAMLALAACSTTQLAKANNAANQIAKAAATLQTDLTVYGPQVAALSGSVSGTKNAAKVTSQVNAVSADASAYAADAQTLLQIVASLTAPAPAAATVSGS